MESLAGPAQLPEPGPGPDLILFAKKQQRVKTADRQQPRLWQTQHGISQRNHKAPHAPESREAAGGTSSDCRWAPPWSSQTGITTGFTGCKISQPLVLNSPFQKPQLTTPSPCYVAGTFLRVPHGRRHSLLAATLGGSTIILRIQRLVQ